MHSHRVGFLPRHENCSLKTTGMRRFIPSNFQGRDAMSRWMSRKFMPAAAALVAGISVFTLLRSRRNKVDHGSPGDEVDHNSKIDEAILESFPASDPPSWTLGEEVNS